MSTFVETDHPRGQTGNAGEFRARTHSDPEVTLDPGVRHGLDRSRDPFNLFVYSGVGSNTADKFPANLTEARAAVRNSRGEPGGGVRAVFLDDNSLRDDLEVVGPADGRPLLIVVESGFGQLKIKSGRVVVAARSRSGNAVHAEGQSNVTVIADSGKKVSTHASGQAEVTVIPGDGTWGLQTTEDDASILIAEVGTAHKIRAPYR